MVAELDLAATDRDAEIVSLLEPLRRYVQAHASARQDTDDIVQETVARVMGARNRLEPGAALAYSIVVARHVILDHAAAAARLTRSQHKMIDLTEPARPDERIIRAEERSALAAALAQIPESARDTLVAHVLDGEPVTSIASQAGATSGSLSAELARTRARLRLDYVLALRGVELPTQRCRPVLLSLSAGDTRRQQALRAGQHLLTCATCSSISEPLLQRRSVLAAVLPWLGLGPAAALLNRFLQASRQAATSSAGTAGTVAVVTVSAVMVAAQIAPSLPDPVKPAVTRVSNQQSSIARAATGRLVRLPDGADLLATSGSIAASAGAQVQARQVPVQAVSADEGFWVGPGSGDRIWVQLTRTGRESPVTVRTGDSVSFTGTVTTHSPGFARRSGVSDHEGASLLTAQGAHISVDEHDITVTAPR